MNPLAAVVAELALLGWLLIPLSAPLYAAGVGVYRRRTGHSSLGKGRGSDQFIAVNHWWGMREHTIAEAPQERIDLALERTPAHATLVKNQWLSMTSLQLIKRTRGASSASAQLTVAG
jgi:hypothetical protein